MYNVLSILGISVSTEAIEAITVDEKKENFGDRVEVVNIHTANNVYEVTKIAYDDRFVFIQPADIVRHYILDAIDIIGGNFSQLTISETHISDKLVQYSNDVVNDEEHKKLLKELEELKEKADFTVNYEVLELMKKISDIEEEVFNVINNSIKDHLKIKRKKSLGKAKN
jgi:hypothetical protein